MVSNFVGVIFPLILNLCWAIGPGFTKYQSKVRMGNSDPPSWDSSVLSYSDEANSYAYWNCHTIPPNMTLCKSVGYSKMVLPNFLQHESLREAIQQANVWVALVNTDCHPDIQRFLCSLYAPVCLKSHQEAKIPPCWELCNEVRNACLPRMRLFGFDWPEIVRCNQFPRLAESMCIPPQENKAVACAPCEQAITLENIASSYCMADVVLRASLQDVIPQNSRAALHLTLSPRTKALKLVRKDGVVVTSTDYQQLRGRNRQKRMRYNYLKSRIYRHAGPEEDEEGLGQEILRTKRDMNWFLRYQQSILQQADNATMNHRRRRNNPEGGGGRKHTNRRRRARDSRLHDLDGITELVLGCSTCSSLIPAAGESRNSGLTVKKWLIMGRRIIDESSKKYSNQVQVTFLAIWDRNSLEFRRSLNAIRRQPVSYLCPKKPSVITDPLRIRGGSFNPSRNLKILRSAPSELSDAPVNANLWRNHRPAHSYGNQMHTEHRRPSSTTISPSNESAVAVSAFSIPKEQLDHNLTPDEMLPHRNDQNRYTQHVDSQRDAKQRSDSQSPRTYPPANELGQQELGREDYRQWRRERRKRQRGQKQRRKQIQTQQQPTQRRTTTLQPAHPINPYMNEQPDVYSRPYWLP